jgi:hypothetical protein
VLRCFVLLSVIIAAPALAQGVPGLPRTGALQQAVGNPADLHLSGTQRTRVEFLNDAIRPGFKRNEDLLMVRSTLMAELGQGPLRFVGEIWDSRAWTISGASAAGTGEVNTLEPVQAFVHADLGALLGKGSSTAVQVGRMMLNIGTRRLIAADDYRNTTAGYTGVRFDVALHSGLSATLLYVLPQQRLPDDRESIRNGRFGLDRESFDLQLWGGYLEARELLPHTDVDITALRLQEHDSPGHPSRDRNLTTLDLHLLRAPRAGHFDLEVEAAWQSGTARATILPGAARQSVSAWFVHADSGYRWSGGWHPRLSLEFDAVSGDRPGGHYTRFDTLFGMRRADFSPGSILSALGRANLLAPALRLEIAPSKRDESFVTARALWAESGSDSFSTSGVRDPSGASGRFAGYEFDSRARHWLVPGVLRAELNAVLYLRRGLLRDAPNAPPGQTTFYTSAALLTVF